MLKRRARHERAIQGVEVNGPDGDKDFADEDADTAALAEGRMQPPATATRDEP